MVEFIITMAVIGVVGMFGCSAVVMYRADPKGWQETFKRFTRTVRAYVQSGKLPKKIEAKITNNEIESWDAEFHGESKAVQTAKPKHEIVETWFEYSAIVNTNKYHYKCACGFSSGRWDKDLAATDSRRHVREAGLADQAKQAGSKLQW